MCKDIGLGMIEGYILHMKEQKGISNSVTLNSYIQNISPLIKYGVKKRYILNQFPMPRMTYAISDKLFQSIECT